MCDEGVNVATFVLASPVASTYSNLDVRVQLSQVFLDDSLNFRDFLPGDFFFKIVKISEIIIINNGFLILLKFTLNQ